MRWEWAGTICEANLSVLTTLHAELESKCLESNCLPRRYEKTSVRDMVLMYIFQSFDSDGALVGQAKFQVDTNGEIETRLFLGSCQRDGTN